MNDVMLESKDITLVETLDKVLNKGVILSGDLTISVADVDLVFVGLKLLLASVETAEKMRCGYKRYEYVGGNSGKGEVENENADMVAVIPVCSASGRFAEEDREPLSVQGNKKDTGQAPIEAKLHTGQAVMTTFAEGFSEQPEEIKAVFPKIDAEPEKVEQGVAKLVLTLVDLIRKLMEKQAIRRIDGGSLSDKEVEKLGYTFMRLENKMEELKKVFGLKDEDLNINLGPIGNLM